MKNSKKNKGFTLIEILASIAILMVILLLVTPKVKTMINNSKENTYNEIVSTIEGAAKNYTYKNTSTIDNSIIQNGYVLVTLRVLQESGLLNMDIKNPYSNEKLLNSNAVKITKTGNTYDFEYLDKGFVPVTLTVNLSGGNTTQKFESTYSQGEIIQLVTPTKAGYILDKWTVTGTGSTLNNNNLTIGVANATLTASWALTTYRITFNANGGTVSPTYKDMTNSNTTYGELPTPTKTGYTFGGWYTALSGGTKITSTSSITNPTSHTLYAHWTANVYKINYNCNGGSGSTASSTHTYGVSSKLSSNGCYKIANGTSGMVYYLKGWGKSSTDSSASYNNNDNVTAVTGSSEVTLYAIWDNGFSYNGNYNVIDDDNGNWRVKFLTSGTLTINSGIVIDAFLVGGGGSGNSYASTNSDYQGGGGGGGYTLTHKNISLSKTSYSIIIGSGGLTCGASGINTTAFGYAALGGEGGNSSSVGAAGGSQAGYGLLYGGAKGYSYGSGPKGQGTTTCEFGEGTLTACTNGTAFAYSGGGSGGHARFNMYCTDAAGSDAGGGGGSGVSGVANTGGGGGGGGWSRECGFGGSGIAIIRNAR